MEKAMAPHSSTLAWKILWTEEPGRLQSMGSLESDTTEWLHFHFSLSCTGEGNGNPLQCSCLENPRDGEAWWAAISGVAQSQTRVEWLTSSSSSSSSSSVWDECNCAVVWAFFGIAFLWDWNEKLTFSSPVATAEFSKFVVILSAALSQHHLSGFEIAHLEFHHLH